MAAKYNDEKQAKLPVQQLAILSICRFAEPLAMTSVFPYLPEMVESFNIPEKDSAQWVGLTSLVFSLSQAVTSIQWGRASDRFGRKPVILTAMFSVMFSSLLFGFSQNLTMAVIARALAGASNGNVGILRTTVAELVPQKSLQPMAFSIMPMIWAVGSSVGPIVGGSLAVPTRQFPGLFAGNRFLEKYKFALPNLFAAVFFLIGLTVGFLFLKETLETKQHKRDYGIVLGQKLKACCCGNKRIKLPQTPLVDQESVPTSPRMARKHPIKLPPAPGWAEVFSPQSNLNILAYTILALHAVTFDQLVPVFLHLSPQDHSPESGNVSLPFKFAGGFGLDSGRIGILFTAMGIVGIIAQFAVFPPMAKRYGILNCFRVATFIFPFLYFALPYVVLLPKDNARQATIFGFMFVKSIMCTFAFPCVTILLTNSAKSVRILGTLNGVSVATSAIGRASGPFLGGGTFSWGVHRGYVIVPWFILGTFAILGHISTWWLIEMDGPTASAAANDDQSQDEEEIGLLSSEAEPEIGQATGAGMDGEVGQRRQDDTHLGYAEREENQNSIGERSPLLTAAVPMTKSLSRDSRFSLGDTGTTLSPNAGRTVESTNRSDRPGGRLPSPTGLGITH